jgi:hypothetical protein
MTGNAGVWIDHRKAVVVGLTANGENISLIDSGVEKHLERTGDSPLNGRFEARQVPADDRRQRALSQHLDVYYDQVIEVLRHFDRIVLFGPGEAKGELHKRMAKTKLDTRVVAVETNDRMTDSQIAAKVRTFFVPSPQAQSMIRA